MVLFTHIVKKIEGAVHKNGDIGSMCKRGLRPIYMDQLLPQHHFFATM